jgi:addiction module RelE/StbE family toxin
LIHVEWSVQALEDRVAIFDYIEADSPLAAIRVDDRIDEEVERLAQLPGMGRPGRVDGTRELVIAQTPYIVAYKFVIDSVTILRILHGAFRRFDKLGIELLQAWGLTETSPVATACTLKPPMRDWTADQRYAQRARQGIALPFTDVRVVSDEGEASWDGETAGEIQVRGPWIASGYFGGLQTDRWTADGWFQTGDVATIDPEGYIKITDRLKDLIKSGGEWISSVDLENALVAHASIREAAVIAIPHPKWQERPLAIVVPKNGAIDPAELRAFLDKELLQATDQAARRTRRNRSALVRDALREYLRRLEIHSREERDRAGYAKKPLARDESRQWEAEAAWPAK